MLKSFKSAFFLKELLNCLITKKLLKLIKYNKSLQKEMDLGIIDYKSFSRRFIVYESKANVVEVLAINDSVLYKGEFLHGERSGKGKEYDRYMGNLIYEGEFLHGERNGKGKEYDSKGNIEFEGEFFNGKKWNGKGKVYNYMLRFNYEGEYLNGKICGKGKEYNTGNKLLFEGEFLNGKKWNGKGYDKNNNVIYELNNGKGFIKEYI